LSYFFTYRNIRSTILKKSGVDFAQFMFRQEKISLGNI
jgi:hypothetical protein